MLSFLKQRCSACGVCAGACERGVHTIASGMHLMDRARCTSCGACTLACPANALEIIGRVASAGDIIDEVRKDETFYRHSGGGLTVSGGEPTQQIDFLEAILRLARHHGIHTAIETCGYAPTQHFERILPLVGQFLFDIKETDPHRHEALTGVSNALILSNLRYLHAAGASVRVRLPLVPGINDSQEHFRAVAALMQQMPRLSRVQLIAFHNLGESKRARFGFPPGPLANKASADCPTIATWQARFSALGVDTRDTP